MHALFGVQLARRLIDMLLRCVRVLSRSPMLSAVG